MGNDLRFGHGLFSHFGLLWGWVMKLYSREYIGRRGRKQAGNSDLSLFYDYVSG